MTNIDINCIYEYYVINGENKSPVFEFSGITHEKGNLYSDFIVFGDWGQGKNGELTKKLMTKNLQDTNATAILHLGDIAYDLEDQEGEVGDIYFRMIEHIAAQYPYMVIPGNHDNFKNYTHYKQRFTMPINEANQGTSYFYSFNYGFAHYILFNSEIFMGDVDNNEVLTFMNWLQADLKQAQLRRREFPWIFTGTHHPLYCSVDWVIDNGNYEACNNDSAFLRKWLEDLFVKHEVDIVFQAHIHNYERTAPIYRNETVMSVLDSNLHYFEPKYPVYITTGNAGNPRGKNDLVSTTPQLWSLARSQDYGFGRLRVFNSSLLYWEQWSSETNKTVDRLYIHKHHN